MYTLLNLYEQNYNASLPVICVDEKSKQMMEDSSSPIAMKPGSPVKYDYEYKRIDFYYTPKHASWLNMAEIEISIMDRQCTGGRIGCKQEMKTEVIAWSQKRNKVKKGIDWSFTKQEADKKLSKHYVP